MTLRIAMVIHEKPKYHHTGRMTYSLDFFFAEPFHRTYVDTSLFGSCVVGLCGGILLVGEEQSHATTGYEIKLRVLVRALDNLRKLVDGVLLYLDLAQSILGTVERLISSEFFVNDGGQVSSVASWALGETRGPLRRRSQTRCTRAYTAE